MQTSWRLLQAPPPLRERGPDEVCCDKNHFHAELKEVTTASAARAVECIIYPTIMPRRADKGRCRESFKLPAKRTRGGGGRRHRRQSSAPTRSTHVFQPVGIMIGTSVGLGIAWTDWGWRDEKEGTGKKGRWSNRRRRPQKLGGRGAGVSKRGAEQIQYLNREINASTCKDRKMCRHTMREIQFHLNSLDRCLFSPSLCHKHKRDK